MAFWVFPSLARAGLSSGRFPRAGRDRRGGRRRGSGGLAAAEVLEPKRPFAVDVLAPIPDQSLYSVAGNSVAIDLAGRFDVREVTGTVVAFETNAPVGDRVFFAELFDQPNAAASRTTPVTVDNFLTYVNAGDYDGTIIHRSITNPEPFVIQGGGYVGPVAAANDPPGNVPLPLASRGTIANEPGNSNLRGTLAMAKVDGQVNSATSQWFFNLRDNVDLNSSNGGFTVFGRVLGEVGLTAVDTMALALDYDALPLYGDQALRNLPLWQLDSDLVVRPNNFLRIESVDELADESRLLSYSVATSNGQVATAAIQGGRVVVTPRQGAAGTATITVTARSVVDGSTRSDAFVVTIRAQPTYTTLDAFGLTTLRREDGPGLLFAGETPIFVGGAQASEQTYSSVTFLGAEAVSGVNTILMRRKDTGEYRLWRLDGGWRQQSGGGLPTDRAQLMALEGAFNTDLDGDGDVGVQLTPIESAGQVTLSVNGRGDLFAGDTVVMVGDSAASLGRYSKITFVAAEPIGGVNTILFRSGADYRIWQLDASWRHQASPGLPAALVPALETGFGLDLDGDKHVGPRQNLIDSVGSVSLERNAAGALFAGGMPVMVGTSQATTSAYSSVTFIGAEQVAGRNTILFRRNDSGAYRIWQLDASWVWQASPGLPGAPVDLARLESAFRVDVNGDGQVRELIDGVGSVPLVKNAAGELFAGQSPVIVGDAPASTGRYGSVTFLGAEPVAGVNTILLRRNDTGAYRIWQLDASWIHKSSPGLPTNPAELARLEVAFGIDINGNGEIGGGLIAIDSFGQVALASNTSGELIANGVGVKVGGSPATLSQYASVTFVGAERVDGVNTILVRRKSTGEYRIWQLDDNWNHTLSAALPADPVARSALEQAFATGLTG